MLLDFQARGRRALKTGEIAQLLDLISESLSTHRAALLAEGELHRLRQQVTLFGLSVARLDVRQHSMRHETAMTEILKAVGVSPDYSALSEEEKLALLTQGPRRSGAEAAR